MVNKAILQGRLTHNPELRHTQSGIPVCSFTVAWSEKYKETENLCFLDCAAWRSTGEFVSKYFIKGQEIAVEGKLVTRKWVDNDGTNRSKLELVVEKAHFCGPKPDNSPDSYRAPNAGSFEEYDEDDENLPF